MKSRIARKKENPKVDFNFFKQLMFPWAVVIVGVWCYDEYYLNFLYIFSFSQ